MFGHNYKGLPSLLYSAFFRNVATPTGKNARKLWNVLSVFSEQTASTACADREFIGKEWTGWLNQPSHLRYTSNTSELLDCSSLPPVKKNPSLVAVQ